VAVSPRLHELLNLARQARTYLTYLEGLGVRHLPRREGVSLPDDMLDRLSESLVEISENIGECTLCPLSRDRRNIVFGEGSSRAALMLIGEAPRGPDDLEGRPFLGEAGHLLTDIIVKGLGQSREDCYLTTMIKCRPAGDRPPFRHELRTCRQFLIRQIASIRPQVILTLGQSATQAFLDTDRPLSGLRGRFHDYYGFAVMPTYHPEEILQNQDLRRPTWEDIKMVISRLKEQSGSP